MHFIKLGDKYINLDNVTTIEPKPDLGYVVHFVGQTHFRSICEMDMADIRRELDKVVLKTDEEKKDDKETECVGCVWNKRRADGIWECTGHHVCSMKLGLRK